MSNSLSKYFSGIAAKRLSQVEIRLEKSNQHEFNATADLKHIFGIEKITFDSTFIFLSDNEERLIKQNGSLTWYDAREKHPTRSEYRFYYSNGDEVINNAVPGDLLVIGLTDKKTVFVIIAPHGSTSEEQLLWLFDIQKIGDQFITKDFSKQKEELKYAQKYIMSSMGIEVIEPKTDYLEELLKAFGGQFPSTFVFSDFARKHTDTVDPVKTPDTALLMWMEKEQILFKTLESYLVKKKLQEGFGKHNDDVDQFIKYSLSVQNRRKSRAGAAFEHHVNYILYCNEVKYSKQPKTERQNTPDFIFPGITEYRDEKFDVQLLTMLGLKTSAKERWAQILGEAERIWPKHLLTLEPAISVNQTDEMRAKEVQLVTPYEIIKTYTPTQQKEIISFSDFIQLVKEKQKKI